MDENTRITLCSYTYNDGRLLDDLLATVGSWSVRPDEIIVVDDGSRRPWQPKPDAPELRLIRHDPNRGNTATRTRVLAEAACELVACVDNDMRLSNNWLEVCREHALRQEVGLVSGSLSHVSGDDLVSVYLRHFGENFNARGGETDFIPGGAWMIRSSVWKDVEGFGDYQRPTGQDNILCERLRKRGYILFVDERASARQVRRLSRHAVVRKLWGRFDERIKEALPRLPGEHDMARFFFESLGVFMLKRTARAVELELPALAYVELLYMYHMLADLLRHGESVGLFSADLTRRFWESSADFLSTTPRLFTFLRRDLTRLGHRVPASCAAASHPHWRALFAGLAPLADSGLLHWLDTHGVLLLLREDKTLRPDFSFYE